MRHHLHLITDYIKYCYYPLHVIHRTICVTTQLSVYSDTSLTTPILQLTAATTIIIIIIIINKSALCDIIWGDIVVILQY